MKFFGNNRNIKEVSLMGKENKDLEKKADVKKVDEKALEQVAGGNRGDQPGGLHLAVEAGYYVDYTGKIH